MQTTRYGGRMKGRFSPSMAVALAALFFSLGGGAMAASRYLITSVSQIKPSVRAALVAHSRPALVQGPQGPAGPAGPPGPQGPAGPSGLGPSTRIVSPAVKLVPGQTGGTVVICPAGDVVLNGGYTGSGETVTESFAKDPNEWAVSAVLQPGLAGGFVEAWVECVPAS